MTEVFFELVRGHCNSLCSFCIFKAHKGFLKRNYFPADKIETFNELNRGKDIGVSFVGFGELTLHPNWVNIIENLEKNFRLATLMTNFCKKMSDEEINLAAKFSKIQIELGGFTEETKRLSLGRGKDFLDENIERLKKAGASPYLKIVKTKITAKETERLDERFVDVAGIYSKQNMRYFNKSFDYDKYFDEIAIEERPRRKTCEYAEIDAPLIITTTGDAMLCYIVPYNNEEQIKELSVGNAFEMSIEDILASDRYKEKRERQLHKKYLKGYCEYCYGA